MLLSAIIIIQETGKIKQKKEIFRMILIFETDLYKSKRNAVDAFWANLPKMKKSENCA